MEKKDLERNLKILVELDLNRSINLIKEGNFPNTEEMIAKTIISFEQTLPEWAKQIHGYHNIIMDTLKRIENSKEETSTLKQQKNNQERDER